MNTTSHDFYVAVHSVLTDRKYNNLTHAEVIGVLEMIKFDLLTRDIDFLAKPLLPVWRM